MSLKIICWLLTKARRLLVGRDRLTLLLLVTHLISIQFEEWYEVLYIAQNPEQYCAGDLCLLCYGTGCTNSWHPVEFKRLFTHIRTIRNTTWINFINVLIESIMNHSYFKESEKKCLKHLKNSLWGIVPR